MEGKVKGKEYLVAFFACLGVLGLGLFLTVQSIDFSLLEFHPALHYRFGFYLVLVSIPLACFFIFGYASLNRNGTKLLKNMPTDPAQFEFTDEKFISQIGKTDRTLRYWMKCILFGLILYVTVGVSSVLSDTLIGDTAGPVNKGFISDFYFLTLSLVTGFTTLFAIRALRGLGDKLEDTSKRLQSDPRKKTKSIKSVSDLVDVEKKGEWLGQSKRFYYYVASISVAAIGGLVGYLTANNSPKHWYGLNHPISSIPFIVSCAVIGFTVGTLIFISARGLAILKRYCQECVLPKNLYTSDSNILDHQDIGETCDLSLDRLRKIGHFSFELNFAAAIPSIAFFASYVSGTKVDGPASLICLSIYTMILISISILPLLPFHTKMAAAKEAALEKINREFRTTYSKFLAGDQTRINRLRDLFDLHERIDRMPAWPLDRWIDSKLLVTIPLPVVLSIFSTFVTKMLRI